MLTQPEASETSPSTCLPSETPLSSLVARPTGGIRFDAIMAILSTWVVTGLFVDGWSHRYIGNLDSFFNPWHATFYSGFLVMAAFTAVTMAQNVRRGSSWRLALPVGYGKTIGGLVLFGIGGVSDMIWHVLFGFEGNIDALLSPSHLLIFTGIALVVSGPVRAAWHRPDGASPARLLHHLPMLASVSLLLTLLTFVTMFLHPYLNTYAFPTGASTPPTFDRSKFGWMLDNLGIGGIFAQTVILMGLVQVILKRWRVPFGSLMVILTFNALFVGFLGRHYHFILLALMIGFGADLLLWLLQPSASQIWKYRLFAFSLPSLLWAGYLLSLAIFTGGVVWSVHLVAGAVAMAGLIGLLVSYAVIAPEVARSPAR